MGKKTVLLFSLPETNSHFAPENLLFGPNRKGKRLPRNIFPGRLLLNFRAVPIYFRLFTGVTVPKENTKGGSYLSLDRKATQVQGFLLGLPNCHENGGSKFGLALTTYKSYR